jgi:hypothetical protein
MLSSTTISLRFPQGIAGRLEAATQTEHPRQQENPALKAGLSADRQKSLSPSLAQRVGVGLDAQGSQIGWIGGREVHDFSGGVA